MLAERRPRRRERVAPVDEPGRCGCSRPSPALRCSPTFGGPAVALPGRGDVRRLGAVPPRRRMRRRSSGATTSTTSGWSCAPGVRHIVHTADLRRLTVATAFVTLAAGRDGGRDLRADRRRAAPAAGVPRRAVDGAGRRRGARRCRRRRDDAQDRRVPDDRVGAGAVGVGVGLLASPTLAIVLVSAVASAIAVSFYNVAFVTLVQRRTDVSMQGRVMAPWTPLHGAVRAPSPRGVVISRGELPDDLPRRRPCVPRDRGLPHPDRARSRQAADSIDGS